MPTYINTGTAFQKPARGTLRPLRGALRRETLRASSMNKDRRQPGPNSLTRPDDRPTGLQNLGAGLVEETPSTPAELFDTIDLDVGIDDGVITVGGSIPGVGDIDTCIGCEDEPSGGVTYGPDAFGRQGRFARKPLPPGVSVDLDPASADVAQDIGSGANEGKPRGWLMAGAALFAAIAGGYVANKQGWI